MLNVSTLAQGTLYFYILIHSHVKNDNKPPRLFLIDSLIPKQLSHWTVQFTFPLEQQPGVYCLAQVLSSFNQHHYDYKPWVLTQAKGLLVDTEVKQ